MTKIMIVLSLMCVLSAGAVYCAEENKNNIDVIIPTGMETIKEGDVNLVVYKGSRPHKQGDVLMTETPDEYASRKFSDMEEHFKRIEKELETQRKDLKTQRKDLEDLKSALKKLEEDGRKK